MTSPGRASEKKDKLLFTPGPLTTSSTVKEAMLRDLGSRDTAFIAAIETIRNNLLGLAGLSREKGYECALMQGSGTFGVESVIGSAVPPGGKLLVVINGSYGERMLKIAGVLGIEDNHGTPGPGQGQSRAQPRVSGPDNAHVRPPRYVGGYRLGQRRRLPPIGCQFEIGIVGGGDHLGVSFLAIREDGERLGPLRMSGVRDKADIIQYWPAPIKWSTA